MTTKQMISLVIPVYRSGEILPELHERLTKVFVSHPDGYEVIFVEDCGGDNSWDVVQTLVANDAHVRGIQMSRNYGQHNALLCGILAAHGDIVITLDDDMQHPPEELPKLVDKLNEGHDVVYGPPIRQQHGVMRDIASYATKLALQSAMGAENARQVGSLRAFRTDLRRAFTDYRSPTVSIDVLLAWATSRFASVPVRHEPRRSGESGYTVGKLIRHAFNMMTGFSTKPLQIASMMGFLFALFGVAVFVYVLLQVLIQGSPVPGFPFLASIISIFSGAQLLALGIMGEYLARMHFRTMERPPYLVRNEIGVHQKDPAKVPVDAEV